VPSRAGSPSESVPSRASTDPEGPHVVPDRGVIAPEGLARNFHADVAVERELRDWPSAVYPLEHAVANRASAVTGVRIIDFVMSVIVYVCPAF